MPTVLVCDDEAVLRALVRAALGPVGYDVLEAADGHEALELVRRQRPDLVVLDMMMPGWSGLEVLAEMRAEAAIDDVPCLMLTARAQAGDRAAALEAGVDR